MSTEVEPPSEQTQLVNESNLEFFRVARSFLEYETYTLSKIYNPRIRKWNSLNKFQKDLIPWFSDHLNSIKYAIERNGEFFREVVRTLYSDTMMSNFEESYRKQGFNIQPSELDMSKTQSILIQITREWSRSCSSERSYLLSKVRSLLENKFPERSCCSNIKISNPGCGLGRFVTEMVKLGFNCEGMENSVHMLLISNYILNTHLPVESITVYPYIHQFSHWKDRYGVLTPIKIPDIDIAIEVKHGGGSMGIGYGSFVDCYGPNTNIQGSNEYSISPSMSLQRSNSEYSLDFVVTNFFIDTGPNILNYIQTIVSALKVGGVWFNFGPLLYHFENDEAEETVFDFDIFSGEKFNVQRGVPLQGLELCADDIISICTDKLQMSLIEYKSDIPSGYGSPKGPNGLPGYKCHFWALRKEKRSGEALNPL